MSIPPSGQVVFVMIFGFVAAAIVAAIVAAVVAFAAAVAAVVVAVACEISVAVAASKTVGAEQVSNSLKKERLWVVASEVVAAASVVAALVVAADLHDVSSLQIWMQHYSFMK